MTPPPPPPRRSGAPMLLLAVTIFLPLATAKRQPPSSPPSLLAQLIDGEFKGATKLVPMAILAGSLALLAAHKKNGMDWAAYDSAAEGRLRANMY